MSSPSTALPGLESRFEPHRIAIAVIWLAAVAALVAMLAQGARGTDRFASAQLVVHAVYAAALVWYLGRTGPELGRLPELAPMFLPRSWAGRFLPSLAVAVLLALTVLSDDGADLVMLAMMAATLGLLAAWWRDIRLRAVAVGMAAGGIALLAGIPFWLHGLISATAVVLLPLFTVPMFVTGGLLIERTGLGASRLYEGRYGRTLTSFLGGCLLFAPLGLSNALDDSPDPALGWVDRWWMPAWQPCFSAITEEAWFRLLLVGLAYRALRPALRGSPAAATVCAIVFSALVFGLGHGRNLDRLLTTGLLYGLPLAAVFTQRDWEHAVGGHYAINLVPWVMVFLDAR